VIQNVLLNGHLTALLGNGTLPLGGDLLNAFGTLQYTTGHEICAGWLTTAHYGVFL